MIIQPNRFPSSATQAALATKLGLPYSDQMQDWEWEVANPARFEEFLSFYDSPERSEDERLSLMEILVQCVEDLHATAKFQNAARQLSERLSANFSLHESTVTYWAAVDHEDPEYLFFVSPVMREILSNPKN